ncbi:hypothetical protein D3C72_817890 [compost metagenome]
MLTTGTHHKAGYILQEDQWYFLLVTVLYKTGCFIGTVAIDYTAQLHFFFTTLYDRTLVGHNTYCPSVNTCITTYNGLTVILFELIEFRIIYDTLDDLDNIIRLIILSAYQSTDLFRIFQWQYRFHTVKSCIFRFTQLIYNSFHLIQAFLLGIKFIISNTADLCMRSGTTQGFLVSVFTNRRFYQVRSGQEDRGITIYHQRLIAHDRQVRPTSHTTTGYSCDLGNSHSTHLCIISEYTSEMLLVREDLVLHRQVYTRTIHDIDHRQAVFHRNLLKAQVFLTRNREPGPGFNRIIIGNDHTLTATYITYTGYRTTGRTTTMLWVHLITGKNP